MNPRQGAPITTIGLQQLPGWLFVISSGKIVFISPALMAWLGYEESSSLLGASAHGLLVRAPLHEPSRTSVPLILLRQDTSSVSLEMFEVPVSLNGEPGVLFWAPEKDTKRQAQSLCSGELSTVIAGLAHELNNPLTYLTLNLDFAGRELVRLEENQEFQGEALRQVTEALQVAREGVERLSAVVRDLRAFSRIKEGNRVVDPKRALELAIALVHNRLRHRAQLQLDFQDVIGVEVNEANLCESLVSLLLLLLRPLRDGAFSEHSLRIQLEQAGEGWVEYRFFVSGPQAQCNLEDSQEFTALQVRISSLGGSMFSQDSRVVLRLRGHLSEPSVLPVATAPSPSSQRGAPPRVLLVEEDLQVAEALRSLLKKDAEIEHVVSGRQAINVLLRDQQYQLILCDLTMPDISGVDVHEAVRRARPGVEQRIVFLSGGVFSQRTRDFLRSVPNRILDKPVDSASLLTLVHGLS